MNILHLNTSDTGGAAMVAILINRELNNIGHNSELLFYFSNNYNSIIGNNNISIKIQTEIANNLEKLTGMHGYFRMGINSLKNIKEFHEADVIHVHNVHGGFLKNTTIGDIARIKPVIWTMHDMWGITGHCTHSFDCELWKTGCLKCPHLNYSPGLIVDRSQIMLLQKTKSMLSSRNNITITAPSMWLLNKIKKSKLNSINSLHIPNFIDSTVYSIQKMSKLHRDLNINMGENNYLIIANNFFSNPHKGYEYFNSLINKISDLGPSSIFIIGDNKNIFSTTIGNVKVNSIGSISDPDVLAKYYNACDVFISLSEAENSPLTILEAIACGCAVVAFDVGGIKELISGTTKGYVASPFELDEIYKGISYFAKQKQSRKFKNNTIIENSSAKIIQKYLNVYRTSINSFG